MLKKNNYNNARVCTFCINEKNGIGDGKKGKIHINP
jgi:hypothetical protein